MNKTFVAASSIAFTALLALGSSSLAQPQSGAQSKPTRECILPRDINSFSAPDDHTVYLRVGVADYYKLDLNGPCNNLTFADGIGLRHDRGDTFICDPVGSEVIVRLSGQIPAYCPVNAMRKLSTPEVALLGKNKP